MGKGLAREFLDFINRGNVVDLAVAVIIGAAFTKVVQAVVELFTTAALNPTMAELGIDSISSWPAGNLLVALLNFVVVAAVVVKSRTTHNDTALETSLLQSSAEPLHGLRQLLLAFRSRIGFGGAVPEPLHALDHHKHNRRHDHKVQQCHQKVACWPAAD